MFNLFDKINYEKIEDANKHMPQIFLGAFCLLSVIPVIGMLFAGPTSAGANEVLSNPPQLFIDGRFNINVFSDANTYISDRFFMRNHMITAHNMLVTEGFSNTMDDSVIAGKEGWLFYGEDMDDITDASPLMDEELVRIADALYSLQTWCEINDKEFVFTIAPNKSTLYSPYLPFETQKSKGLNTNAKRLEKLLQEKNVNYVNLFGLFEEESRPLYLKHDSHWGNEGAAKAADAINAALGRKSNYGAGDFSKKIYHQGDLFDMLYPTRKDREEDSVYIDEAGNGLDYEIITGGTNANAMYIETKSKGTDTAYVFRDSFGITLYPYLADSFEEASFSRSTDFDITQAEAADYVIIEIVERNLDYLLNIQSIDDTLLDKMNAALNLATKAADSIDEEGIKEVFDEAEATDEEVAVSDTDEEIEKQEEISEASEEEESADALQQEETSESEAVATADAEVLESAVVQEENAAPVVEETPAPQPAEEPAALSPAEQKAKAMGYVGSSAGALKKAIGKPKSSAYAPSCLGDGEDGELYYDGFVVYTYKEGGSEEVTYVE